MTDCTNPECYCQGVEPGLVHQPFVSGTDRDKAFGSVISKLQNASDELARMEDEGQVDTASGNGDLGVMLSSVIYELRLKHREAAERYGFTIRGGIGPGDWERK